MAENADTVVINIEGQSFDLPAEFASTDELLVLALKPRFPNIGEPTIERADKDGQTHITVIKRGGDKNSAADDLRAAPRCVPRAMALAHELEARENTGGLSPEILFAREAEIAEAIEAAEAMVREIDAIVKSLSRARPTPYGQVPAGF